MGNAFITWLGKEEGSSENTYDALDKTKIKAAFDVSYKNAATFKFTKDSKVVVFSDIHRGDGHPKTDMSYKNRDVYLKALEYYLEAGYTLIHLGDVEDAWMHPIDKIMGANLDMYALEKKFYDAGRLIKVAGNHDDLWYDKAEVVKHLHPVFPEIVVYDAIKVYFDDKEVFMLHGHQGYFVPGSFTNWYSKIGIRYFFDNILRLFNSKRESYTTPATNDKMASELDDIINEWTTEHQVTTVGAHTHHPVVKDDSKIEGAGCPRVISNSSLYYYNTGCCCYSDGSISGIDIVDGKIRLVTFSRQDDGSVNSVPHVVESNTL